MRQLIPALLAAALLVPGTASAATFGEVPIRRFASITGCLHPTGAPGEFVDRLGRREGAQIVRASREGFATALVTKDFTCPRGAVSPNGAGVLFEAGSQVPVAAIRDPGSGAYGEPVELSAAENTWSVEDITGAISYRGDVVVVWAEHRNAAYRLRAARRAPGGGFGAPEVLATSTGSTERLQAGTSATGETVVLWSTTEADGPPVRQPVQVSIGAPDGGFSTTRLAEMPRRRRLRSPSRRTGARSSRWPTRRR